MKMRRAVINFFHRRKKTLDDIPVDVLICVLGKWEAILERDYAIWNPCELCHYMNFNCKCCPLSQGVPWCRLVGDKSMLHTSYHTSHENWRRSVQVFVEMIKLNINIRERN